MPLTPNDPDYHEIMNRYREKAQRERIKRKRPERYCGMSNLDPNYEQRREREKLRKRKKAELKRKQKANPVNNSD